MNFNPKNKKPVKPGEQASPDTVGGPAMNKQVNNTERMDSYSQNKNNNIGGLPTFGGSKTKSLARAMQENKTKNVASDIASKMTDAAMGPDANNEAEVDPAMEALKERARKRAAGK